MNREEMKELHKKLSESVSREGQILEKTVKELLREAKADGTHPAKVMRAILQSLVGDFSEEQKIAGLLEVTILVTFISAALPEKGCDEKKFFLQMEKEIEAHIKRVDERYKRNGP